MAAQGKMSAPQPVTLKEQMLIPLTTFTAVLLLLAAALVFHGVSRDGWAGSIIPVSAFRPGGLMKEQRLNRANDPWPVSRTLSCGNGTWQREYAALHARMLRKEVPPRYIVALGINGLADSFVGAMTLFWVAVLQRRAFFMSFRGSGGSYEWAFDQPNINWSWDEALLADGNVTNFQLVSRREYKPEPMLIRFGDVRQLGPQYTTLRVKAAKGFLWPLMDNTHHKEELRQMGLHPANVMACGVDFLFRMKPEALAPHAKELAQLSDPAALKVGMHIREGDKVLVAGHGPPPLEKYAAFFDCAAQLEAHRAKPGQTVWWYLLTDSVALRRQAKERFGDKLVTNLDATVAHTRMGRRGGVAADPVRVFQTAAAEMFMLGLTDYQIITTHSGYGRMGSFMSGKYHQVFGVEMHKDKVAVPANISCGIDDYTTRWNM